MKIDEVIIRIKYKISKVCDQIAAGKNAMKSGNNNVDVLFNSLGGTALQADRLPPPQKKKMPEAISGKPMTLWV